MNSQIKQKQVITQIIAEYENELKEISMFLHEEIAQNLYAVFNHLQFLQQHMDNQDRMTLNNMIKLTKKTIEDTRRLSTKINPFVHKRLEGALATFVADIRKDTQVEIKYVNFNGLKQISLFTEVILYRIVKDIITAYTDHCKIQHILIETIWEEELKVKIDIVEVEKTSMEKDEFSLLYHGIEERVMLVSGRVNLLNPCKNQTILNLSIPNVR
ncbi:signal transduction histidine kinase [Metabacillus crassostreae]|uniref:hypothetical protein n=1 Tax=Metabacillus crassostreae TaxID=929098 RepID=UPI00195D2B60|nr:hypothetical protein [Metabacillus crassostreae]MBM7605494.1 signal transduction histidine kinase [Metabacillus crassostreae]